MPDPWSAAARRVMRLLPPDIAERAFLPAWHDARRRHVVGRRRTRSAWARAWLHIRLGAALASLALQSGRLAAANRQARRRLELHRNPPSGVDPMLLQDVRLAARMLWKNPGFALTAIAVLAITIGANTAIFSIVQTVLLRPLPFGDPGRIVRIHETARGGATTVSPPNFADWVRHNRTFEQMAAFDGTIVTLGGTGVPERVDAAMVGVSIFDVLGVRPRLGRPFAPDDERTAGPRPVVLGASIWRRRFGGDPGVVGRTITIDARPHQVIGVLPDGVSFPDGFELWLPLVLGPSDLSPNQRGAHYISVAGRLKPGVSAAQAQQDLAAIEQRIAAEFPSVQGYGVWVQPLLDSIVGDYRRPLWMLLGAVMFVLLIGCANISNLLLARGTSRRAEMAVRSALGAGRRRIVRQLLAESTLLGVIGGLAGLALAVWGVRGLELLLPADVPRTDGLGLDSRVLGFTIAVSLLTGLGFGLAPALEASRVDVVTALKQARRDGSGGLRRGTRRLLIVVEVALALVLLAGAGLSFRSFERLSRVDPGFQPEGALIVELALPEARYPDGAAVVRFFDEYVSALSRQPGVIAAGAISIPPLGRGGFGGTFNIIGRELPADAPSLQVRAATPGYLEAVRVPLRRGRTIQPTDNQTGAHVAVITDETARIFWPGEDPIGKRIRLHVSSTTREREREIVGVVGDVKGRTIEGAIRPSVYVPHAQYPWDAMTVFVRGAGDPMELAPIARTQLADLDTEVALGSVRPARELVNRAVAQPRFRMVLLGLFAAVALVLAAIGLYGVMAFSVSQQRYEIGLRIALGAERSSVLGLVLRQGMLPVIIGMAGGLAGAAAMTGVMRGMLYGIEPFDPTTFVAVTLLLATVAAMACYVPARRAASVDPIVALRSE